jgi:hypothetical protein
MARSCIESVNAGEELAPELETLKTGLLPRFSRGIGGQKSIVLI